MPVVYRPDRPARVDAGRTLPGYNGRMSVSEPRHEDSDREALADVFRRVARVLNAVRPSIQADGGDVELVDVSADGLVRIRMHGACVGCPSSSMTLREGIERNVRDHVPEIRAVEAVD